MAKRKDIQSAMASKRFDGPYARDAYPEGLGGDWTRDEHAKEPAPRKAPKKRIGKASE
jgi:hypothetical protein